MDCQNEARRLLKSHFFLQTPIWGEFFYYAKDRETLMDLYEAFLDNGFRSLEQPHETQAEAFVAKVMDKDGKIILLRSA